MLNEHGHTTAHEIAFLEHLGTHTQARNKPCRLTLLKIYRESMKERERWGNIDPIQVAEAVDRFIKEEEQQNRARFAAALPDAPVLKSPLQDDPLEGDDILEL